MVAMTYFKCLWLMNGGKCRTFYNERMHLVLLAHAPDVVLHYYSSCLFPEDNGLCTPNLSNMHMHVVTGAEGGDRGGVDNTFSFPSDIPGRPYRWAQWLGGLYFSSAGQQVIFAIF